MIRAILKIYDDETGKVYTKGTLVNPDVYDEGECTLYRFIAELRVLKKGLMNEEGSR